MSVRPVSVESFPIALNRTLALLENQKYKLWLIVAIIIRVGIITWYGKRQIRKVKNANIKINKLSRDEVEAARIKSSIDKLNPTQKSQLRLRA
ncbi:hypothetical protein ANSO36C_54240 [Nostoc cf. commune SO-36]|uniref:Transposase n=1 Tax=Nostoc cf. commune SO-36 TaxID=449208 RepID=A0ABN6QCD8_NOSCO|nr:hypothetical protein ANSO36C_54240 [Nostoc cf. commune SO-36]